MKDFLHIVRATDAKAIICNTFRTILGMWPAEVLIDGKCFGGKYTVMFLRSRLFQPVSFSSGASRHRSSAYARSSEVSAKQCKFYD